MPKVLEKIISNRLTEHLAQNNLIDVMLSAHRSFKLYVNYFIKSAKRCTFSSNEVSDVVLVVLDSPLHLTL